MSKRVLAAGIVRDFEFDCMEQLEIYLYQLQRRCISYKVIETYERCDNSVVVRILMQFGNYRLVDLVNF